MKRIGPFLAVALVAACASEDIPLATLPAEDGGSTPAPARCVENADCAPGLFCNKVSCDAPVGRCEAPPVICGAEGPPVCGCDGVTYWNDCLRRASAVRGSIAGECAPGASPCGGLAMRGCPEGAFCGRLLPPMAMCAREAPGNCWVLPSQCPPPGPGDRWLGCGPPPVPCLDTCTAIRTGMPHRRAVSGCP
jgi:hypothetical protein